MLVLATICEKPSRMWLAAGCVIVEMMLSAISSEPTGDEMFTPESVL